jgi:hypothetical protein
MTSCICCNENRWEIRDGANVCASCGLPYAPVRANEHKTCPMCAEEIKQAAAKCRFCGYAYKPERTPMTHARVVAIKAKVDRGELLPADDVSVLNAELSRASAARVETWRQLGAAQEAEVRRLGRRITSDEITQLYARDPSLAQAKAMDQFNNQRCALLTPLSSKDIGLRVQCSEANLVAARATVARDEERSHAALFAVSPLAWAVKKTWNGSPRRR